MNRVRLSWAGVLLSVVCGLWAATILLEFIAAQHLLGAPDVDWQSEYDSGEMAFASIPALFTMLLASLAAVVALVVVAVRGSAGWCRRAILRSIAGIVLIRMSC